MNAYIFTVRPTFQGPHVSGFHKLTGEKQDVSVCAMMTLGARVNGFPGVYKITDPEYEWNMEVLEAYLRTLNVAELNTFLHEALLAEPAIEA